MKLIQDEQSVFPPRPSKDEKEIEQFHNISNAKMRVVEIYGLAKEINQEQNSQEQRS